MGFERVFLLLSLYCGTKFFKMTLEEAEAKKQLYLKYKGQPFMYPGYAANMYVYDIILGQEANTENYSVQFLIVGDNRSFPIEVDFFLSTATQG